jgi:hypothetical protein
MILRVGWLFIQEDDLSLSLGGSSLVSELQRGSSVCVTNYFLHQARRNGKSDMSGNRM